MSPALIRVLDRLDTPAQVVSDLGVTLKQNPLAEALMGVQTRHTGLRRSNVYRWFTDPDERSRFHPDDHEMLSRNYAANLRAVDGRWADDHELHELIDHLVRESEDFAEIWERHEVASRIDTRKRFIHPLVGPMTLDCQILTSENLMERLVVFTATAGSDDAKQLELLAVIGTQEISSEALAAKSRVAADNGYRG